MKLKILEIWRMQFEGGGYYMGSEGVRTHTGFPALDPTGVRLGTIGGRGCSFSDTFQLCFLTESEVRIKIAIVLLSSAIAGDVTGLVIQAYAN